MNRTAHDLSNVRDEVIALRREFHRHPELSNREIETSKRVQAFLKKYGIPFEIKAGNGVVAFLEGKEKAAIALRADMDALPVEEKTGLPFASENPGVMHACGHDAHMAIALCAARILNQHKQLRKSLKIIFQPSEESSPSGAPRMIEEGALADVKAMLGFHVWAGLPTGAIAVLKGPVMASADRFEIVFHGKGGHGAIPHMTKDPIMAAAHFITQLQSIVSRQNDPQNPLVVSLGKICGGDAFNIIPEEVTLAGTVRTFDSKQNRAVRKRIKNLLSGLERAFGVKSKMNYEGFVPVTWNNPALASRIAVLLTGVPGVKKIITDAKPKMGSEDFSFYSRLVPCCYFFVGCAKGGHFHHSPYFDIDENCLEIAVRAIVQILANLAG